ncbi:MAG: YraN family protein [Tissierellia bacterium]|nr:YraN family protein [Tissierellia bacterium]
MKSLGKRGEDLAATFLENLGYRILQRNYRTRRGEVDIVALDRFTLVFVEVKSRRSSTYGRALEAVDEHKQRQIYQTAEAFLHEHQGEGYYDLNVRFDVVEVYGTEPPEIYHHRGCFDGNGLF